MWVILTIACLLYICFYCAFEYRPDVVYWIIEKLWEFKERFRK